MDSRRAPHVRWSLTKFLALPLLIAVMALWQASTAAAVGYEFGPCPLGGAVGATLRIGPNSFGTYQFWGTVYDANGNPISEQGTSLGDIYNPNNWTGNANITAEGVENLRWHRLVITMYSGSATPVRVLCG